jgi:hypothetical protein
MKKSLITSCLFLILSIFLINCTSNIKDKIKEENIKYTKDSLNKISSLNIVLNKYNAQPYDKISSLDFTYQYQNVLDINNKIVFQDFKIIDISKKDANYNFKIETGFIIKQIIEFTCTSSQFQKFSKVDFTDIYFDDKYLILEINSITKTDMSVTSSGQFEDETSVKTNLDLDDSNLFLLQASFIDFLND